MASLVSIIVPVYNAADYLDRCLETILGQSYRDIEVICVDDGSTDATPEILQRHAEADERLRVLTQENSYAGVARNRGMEEAKGEYFLFLDADDYFDGHMVELLLANAQSNDSDIVICHASYHNQRDGATSEIPDALIDELIPSSCRQGEGVFAGEEVAEHLFQLCLGWAWDKLFARSFVEEQGLSFQALRSSNDALFVYSALALAKRISIVPERLPFHRIHNESSISNSRKQSCQCAYRAALAIHDALVEKGCYEAFERSFVNWEASFLLWHFESLLEGAARTEMVPGMREILEGHIKPAALKGLCAESGDEGEDVDSAPAEAGEYFYRPKDVEQLERDLRFEQWYGPDNVEELRARPYADGTLPSAVAGTRKDLDHAPKVSVVVPIYNAGSYLVPALDSLARQTLADIEIICIDDGSTDDSLFVAKEYELHDPRFVVVNKRNGGYGSAMNLGIDCARGRYLGILEPDDRALPHMFESLYRAAEAHDAQIAKADFYRFVGEGEEERRWLNMVGTWDDTDLHNYNRVVCPLREQELFTYVMNTWAGIYRLDFLREHDIRHNETPGASFQDNGFWFLGFAYCERLVLIREPGYLCRRDNPGSSVNDPTKALSCRNEYLLIRECLQGRDPELFAKLSSIFWYRYMTNVSATLERVDLHLWKEVLETAQRDLAEAFERGEIDYGAMPAREAEDIRGTIDDPIAYLIGRFKGEIAEQEARSAALEEQIGDLRAELDELYASHSFKVGNALMTVPRKMFRR